MRAIEGWRKRAIERAENMKMGGGRWEGSDRRLIESFGRDGRRETVREGEIGKEERAPDTEK